MKNQNKILIISLIFLLGLSAVVYAADSYRVNNNTTVLINEHGVAKNVQNNACGVDRFVPTKTSTEWANFRTNKPACMVLTDPVTQCAATTIHGHSLPLTNSGDFYTVDEWDCGPGRESWIICSAGSHNFQCNGTTWDDYGTNWASCRETHMSLCQYF